MAVSTTHKQAELLAFLAGFIADNDGIAPSFEEMKDHLGLASKSGVHRLLLALEERGKITRKKDRARAIAITPDAGVLSSFSTVALLSELARRREVNAELRAG